MSDKGMDRRRPHPQAVRKETLSRRSALGTIGRWVIGGALTAAAGSLVINKSQENPPYTSKPKPEAIPVQEKEKLRRDKLNMILALRLDNPKRKDLEKDYANWAEDLSDINLGLLALSDPNSRIKILEKRYLLRSSENPNHKLLTPEQVAWADSENIFPETLAMALDGRELAIRVLGELIIGKGKQALRDELANPTPEILQQARVKGTEKFRPDIVDRIKKGEIGKEVLDNLIQNPELMLLSAGGMARLIVTESGFGLPKPGHILSRLTGRDWIMYGFANIGEKPAMEMTIDATAQPKRPNDSSIIFLTDIISKHTGLNFIPENIPGSERDKNSSTGGALGIQIMPRRAQDLYEGLSKFFKPGDPLPHPLDPIGSVALAYLFIAQGVITKDGYHNGYTKGSVISKGRDISNAINAGAINTWNADQKQTIEILASDKRYIGEFIQK